MTPEPLNYTLHQLANGLTVLLHPDPTTPMAVVNVLYKVGAKVEDASRTGFAHLFEHLMFGGSEHADSFDGTLQLAGGNNNAFTNNDITNYYDILPASNIATALWLEADRMARLSINERSLDVQRKVVIEEFKENYLNQPYGNVWHLLRNMCYQTHPYRWPTIGLTTQHIAEASLQDVQAFYDRYYAPDNAILVVAGGIDPLPTLALIEQYFGSIPPSGRPASPLHPEPIQTSARKLVHQAQVPDDALYLAFPMANRLHEAYYRADLLSDILAGGPSSRFQLRLVKGKKLFSSLSAYITGNIDPGLFMIQGKPNPGITLEEAEAAIWEELNLLAEEPIAEEELQKVKNKVESGFEYSMISLMNRAYQLAYFTMLGNPDMLFAEKEKYTSLYSTHLQEEATRLFTTEQSNTLFYQAAKA